MRFSFKVKLSELSQKQASVSAGLLACNFQMTYGLNKKEKYMSTFTMRVRPLFSLNFPHLSLVYPM